MKVLKFGGTSLGSPERFKSVAHLVSSTSEPKLVVLSAISGTTNTLVEIGSELLGREADNAMQLSLQLKTHYDEFIDQLFQQGTARSLAQEFINKRFQQIYALTSTPFGK